MTTPSLMSQCPRSTVKRTAKRASSDREQAYALIDKLKTGHVAFIENGEPRNIPLTLWRVGDELFVHSLNGGRLSKTFDQQPLLCISFAQTNEWVMAKSAYHHSANYESLVLFGQPQRVSDDEEFDRAFKVIINQISENRWDEVRPPSQKERKATALFKMKIEEGSFKSRTGEPSEEPEDLDLPVWHGLIKA